MTNNLLYLEIDNHDEILQSLIQKDILEIEAVRNLLARYLIEYINKTNTKSLCKYIHDEICEVDAYHSIGLYTRPGSSHSWSWRAKEACLLNMDKYSKGSIKWSVNISCAVMLQIINKDDTLAMSAYDMVNLLTRPRPEFSKLSWIPFIGRKYKHLAKGSIVSKTALAIELKEIISQEIKQVA